MRISILLSFLFFFAPAFSQKSNLIITHVTFSNGTQENGRVDYRSWFQNPKSILFFSDKGSSFELQPKDVTVVDIFGKDIYEGVVIKRYTNALSFNDISESEEEPVIEEPVFLRLLSKGNKISLYSYVDGIKTHYFIKDSMGAWLSLRYKKFYVHGSEQITNYPIYKGQLAHFVNGNKAAEKMLANMRWTMMIS